MEGLCKNSTSLCDQRIFRHRSGYTVVGSGGEWYILSRSHPMLKVSSCFMLVFLISTLCREPQSYESSGQDGLRALYCYGGYVLA